jgi:hypothetical protein
MMFPYGFTATVERPTQFDREGIAVDTEFPDKTIARCARDQVRSVKTVDGVEVVVTDERILCDDPDADVHESDVLVLPDGTRWHVTGEPDRPHSPFSNWRPGCVIPVERVAGATPPQPIEE